MSSQVEDTAWKLGMQLLLRQVIADTYHSSDKAQFQRQIDGLLKSTLVSIETGAHFPGAAEEQQVKKKASDLVKGIVTSIKPA